MSVQNRDAIRRLRAAVVQASPACTTADAVLFTGPDAFEVETDADRQERESAAKAVCATCPARLACLDYALAVRPREGVWAGFTFEEITGLAYGTTGSDSAGVMGEVA